MRRLVENMQRCVLRGLPPVLIAVESESSILRRWRRLVRIKLNFRLASLKSEDSKTVEAGPPKKPAKTAAREAESDEGTSGQQTMNIHAHARVTEQQDPSEEAAFNDDVEIIQAMIESLRSSSNPTEEDLKKFHELIREIDQPVWSVVMYDLSDSAPDDPWARRFSQARSLCLEEEPANGRPSQTLLKKLRGILRS